MPGETGNFSSGEFERVPYRASTLLTASNQAFSGVEQLQIVKAYIGKTITKSKSQKSNIVIQLMKSLLLQTAKKIISLFVYQNN